MQLTYKSIFVSPLPLFFAQRTTDHLSSRKPPRASSYQLNRYLSTPAASIHERTSTNSSPWTTEISRAEMGRKLKEIMESIQGMDHMNGTSSSMAAGRNYEDEMMVELERIEKELET